MSPATEVFDPYREWLGIEPHELPADHYRLLGLARFETDAAKIAAAADARMGLIRSNQTGPRGAFTYTLLNEITAAKLCLLSPVAKAQYDQYLQQRLKGNAVAAPVAFFPTAVPLQSLPPAYSQQRSGGMPTLEPPLAAPPVLPVAVPLAPPKQARKSELAIDPDKPPSENDTVSPKGSRLWTAGLMAIAVLLIAGGIWGTSRFLFPPADETASGTNADGTHPGDSGEEPKPEPPPDPAAKATLVLQEGSGELSLPPSAAALTGVTSLKIAISEHVLRGWTSVEDSAIWKFKLPRPGFFNLDLNYAAAHEGPDLDMELLLDDEPLHRFHLPATGGDDKFQTVPHTIVVKASGTHILILRPTDTLPTDSLTIKSLRLTPVGTQQPSAEASK